MRPCRRCACIRSVPVFNVDDLPEPQGETSDFVLKLLKDQEQSATNSACRPNS